MNDAGRGESGLLERKFGLARNGTDVRTEVVAGITTFLTMAYIVFVNPAILANAGMDKGAVFVATCLAAAISTLIMALYANYPIALAPGMGLNAFFAFTLVLTYKYTWQQALGFVFVSGQLPIAPDGTKLADASFEKQAQCVLDNVANALKGAGSGVDKLVQVRVYVTDIGDWPAFNALYAKWAGNAKPARCVVPVPQLHYGFLIEIEAVAERVASAGGGPEHAGLNLRWIFRSGERLLTDAEVKSLLKRGGQLRLLTGDYLGVTEPDALSKLLDLPGRTECRVFETGHAAALDAPPTVRSFHPKAYLFSSSNTRFGVAFVGSSNLSKSALTTGIEWNVQHNHLGELLDEFDHLWADSRSLPLTGDFIEAYAEKCEARMFLITERKPS